MKTRHMTYLSNRVLKLNVGFLLNEGPGNSQDSRLDIPDPIRVADDLTIYSLAGDLRLSRMKEGILVQAALQVRADNECSRCLTPLVQELDIELEELYAHPHPNGTEFAIGADGILDLAPLLRAETIILTSHAALCHLDCRGLCPHCGINRNEASCDCERDNIDPRLAKLKELLDSAD